MLPEQVYGREGDVFWDPGRGTDIGDGGPSTGESDFDIDINEFGKMFIGTDDAKLDASARKTSSPCSLSLLVDTR